MGTLFVVATPIGNLKDVTFRALDVLKSVDLILCEDTRVTLKLLRHYGIQKPMKSFFVGNENQQVEALCERLDSGETMALVTDAGTPGISDPGYVLVRACHERGIPVSPVPGASAAATALSASGLPAQRVLFLGFPPRKAGERARFLEDLTGDPATLVFYEAPHRIRAFLREAAGVLGNRECVVGRELTKRFETIAFVSDPEAVQERGEFVVLFGPPARATEPVPDLGDVSKRMAALVAEGLDEKEAMRRVARERGVPRREIYSKIKVKDREPE